MTQSVNALLRHEWRENSLTGLEARAAMAGKYTITELWGFAGSLLGVSPSTVLAIGRYANRAGYMPDSDRSRGSKPQTETPQAAAAILSLAATGPQTMVATETGFAWNLPAASSLDAIRDGLARLGVEIPSDARFGRDVVQGLLEAVTRPGGQAWLAATFSGLTVWQESTRAALTMRDGTLIEFETAFGRQYRLGRHTPALREVRTDVLIRAIIDLGKFVFLSRMEAARIGHVIPTEATLKGLEFPTPPSPDPFAGGDQDSSTSPDNTKADGAPPPPASASNKITRPASLQSEHPNKLRGYSLSTKEGSAEMQGGHPQKEGQHDSPRASARVRGGAPGIIHTDQAPPRAA